MRYNAYVYHKTKEAAIETIRALRNQKLVPEVNCEMSAYGAAMPLCNLCGKDGHTILSKV